MVAAVARELTLCSGGKRLCDCRSFIILFCFYFILLVVWFSRPDTGLRHSGTNQQPGLAVIKGQCLVKHTSSETFTQLLDKKGKQLQMLSNCHKRQGDKETKHISFYAFISVRNNFSGSMNSDPINALLEFGEPQHFLFLNITALSVVGMIPFGRDMCTVK